MCVSKVPSLGSFNIITLLALISFFCLCESFLLLREKANNRHTPSCASRLDTTTAWLQHQKRMNEESSSSSPGAWETVPAKKKQQQRSNRNKNNNHQNKGNNNNNTSSNNTATSSNNKAEEADPSTLFPQYQPIPKPEQGSFEQSIVLLVGLPGSGKSTFGRIVEKCLSWKYGRVNQDELSSRQKCISRANQILRNGLCPIVDRCNFDAKQRSYFLNLAAANNSIPVDCIVFDIDPNVCLSRCKSRRGHPTLPPNNAGRVIGMMAKDWKPPNAETEGFREVFVIRDNQTFHEVMSKFVPPTVVVQAKEASSTSTEEEKKSDKQEIKIKSIVNQQQDRTTRDQKGSSSSSK